MNYTIDHCEPFDGKAENIWMKAEHIGRYLFAADFFAGHGGGKILDVACAEGFGSRILAQSGCRVCGADINEQYLLSARQRCEGDFVAVDLETEELPGTFGDSDGAVCFETVEHLDNGEELLQKISARLKGGAYLLLSFPNQAYEKVDENGVNYDPYHKRIFSRAQMLSAAQEAGFSLVQEYGQSLCNALYASESDAKAKGRLSQGEIDGLFRYDEESLLCMAKLIGYPTPTRVEDSYSFLWVLKKEIR